MKYLHLVTFTLMAVGALNWGLVALFNFNLVETLLAPVATVVYVLVGASAVYEVATHSTRCKQCMEMMKKG